MLETADVLARLMKGFRHQDNEEYSKKLVNKTYFLTADDINSDWQNWTSLSMSSTAFL